MVVCMKTGRVFGIHIDSVFEQSLVNYSLANTASTEEAYEDRHAALW